MEIHLKKSDMYSQIQQFIFLSASKHRIYWTISVGVQRAHCVGYTENNNVFNFKHSFKMCHWLHIEFNSGSDHHSITCVPLVMRGVDVVCMCALDIETEYHHYSHVAALFRRLYSLEIKYTHFCMWIARASSVARITINVEWHSAIQR